MKFGLSDDQFNQVDPMLEQRAKVEAGFDAADVGERFSIRRLQAAQGEIFEHEALTQQAPFEMSKRDPGACCLLDLANDIFPCPLRKGFGSKIDNSYAGQCGKQNRESGSREKQWCLEGPEPQFLGH